MGHLSFFASKLNNNIKKLEDYDNAIRFFKSKIGKDINFERHKEEVEKLLNIIEPISSVLKGELSKSTEINEYNIIDTLKRNSEKDNWVNIKEEILNINENLHQNIFKFVEIDLKVLNDLGDAIELECNKLFNKMKQSR